MTNKKSRKSIFCLGVAVLLALSAGCSAPYMATYRLAPQWQSTSLTGYSGPGVLVVATPLAEAGFDSDRMAYNRGPYQLEYYTRSSWVQTPADMLLPIVVRAMEQTHAFKAVVPMPTTVSGLQLQIDEVQMGQDFTQTPSLGRVSFRAQLINPDSNRVIAARRFDGAVPAVSENAAGGVTAINKALADIIPELQMFAVRKY